MSILKKKKPTHIVETPEGKTVPLQKNLQSASLEPIPYKHTEKFKKDGEDPLGFERERISHKDMDSLLMEQRIPAIKADTQQEIEEGQKQYYDHIYACRKIIDMEKGELQRVYDMKNSVQDEIAEYAKLKEELLANSRKFG